MKKHETCINDATMAIIRKVCAETGRDESDVITEAIVRYYKEIWDKHD